MRRKTPGADHRLPVQPRTGYEHRSLTDAEQSKLLRGFQAGAREPLDKLIEAHLPSVVSIAGEFPDRGLGYLDLVAEGTMGLISAARHFDEARFSSFVGYAEDRIRQTIVRAIGEMDSAASPDGQQG